MMVMIAACKHAWINKHTLHNDHAAIIMSVATLWIVLIACTCIY